MMVIRVNMKVVSLAVSREILSKLNFLEIFGRISLVITAEMVLMSEEVMDMVFANKDAITNPTNPDGKSKRVSCPYD
jgi:hypothetical protein